MLTYAKVVACSLLYEFVRLLAEKFSDGTLDMLLALLSRWWFSREHDARTGYDERVPRSHTD